MFIIPDKMKNRSKRHFFDSAEFFAMPLPIFRAKMIDKNVLFPDMQKNGFY